LSLRNLEYPKQKEKPPFQTWEQVLRKTKGNADSELWNCVFLAVSEVEELLAHVRSGVSLVRGHEREFSFVYPMLAFCAYTGCRRSEMLRARVEDIDFDQDQLTIREKKKDRSKTETYRHIPLVPKLRRVLEEWTKIHPGGDLLFCRQAGEPLTAQMASHHFRWAVEGSKWKVLPGFHCLRHSLISNLASHGVSDHVIMGIVGHLNGETTKRYIHLRPQTFDAAMELVFGG
jgi:integrase